MSKPITGTVVWKGGRWQVRIRQAEQDVYLDTETADEALAKKLQPRVVKKWLAGEAKKTSRKVAILKVPAQTVSELAKEYYVGRLEAGKANARGERRWFELHVEEHLGAYQPKSVTVADAERVLMAAKKKGLSLESATKVRAEISRLWTFFLKSNLATLNVGELADLPNIEEDERPREILTDAEFTTYLAHPDEKGWTPTKEAARKAAGQEPLVDREVKTMATIARCVGGARTSDLHALTWEAIDTASWETIKIFRPKTKKTNTYYLPAMVVPVLQQWWADAKQTKTGPVFPTRSNGGRKRADGSEKKGKRVKASYAKAFRRDLLTAGVDRPELHKDTETSRQIDFHSLRRGFVTAVLEDTNTDTRDSMKLAGHGKGSYATHQLYNMKKERPMVIPSAALPVQPALTSEPDSNPSNRPTNPETIHKAAENAGDQSCGDESLGTILEALKKLNPENLLEFSGFISGADGTRTRGLRRDRPAL